MCAPQKLSYTWAFGEQETHVTFELQSQGDHTLLILNHKNIVSYDHRIAIGAGWHAHFGILIDRLNGIKPQPFNDTHQALQSEYRQRLS